MKKTPKPVDKHVGVRIRSRRMQLGHSQEWLGDQIGLTFQQIQKYEGGKNRVGGSRMVEIADALGVNPAYFFEGLGRSADAEATSNPALAEFITSTDGLAIIAAFPTLHPKVRRAFARCIVATAGGE